MILMAEKEKKDQFYYIKVFKMNISNKGKSK